MNRQRTIAIAILIWNAIGIAAFAAQWSADPNAMAASDPVTAEAFATMPGWAWSAYALAVAAGLGGAVALLLRRRLAIALFALSVVAVVVQFSWSFAVFGLIARKGPATLVFPLIILLIALAQLAWARRTLRPKVRRAPGG